jgi:hypothetical protein
VLLPRYTSGGGGGGGGGGHHSDGKVMSNSIGGNVVGEYGARVPVRKISMLYFHWIVFL